MLKPTPNACPSGAPRRKGGLRATITTPELADRNEAAPALPRAVEFGTADSWVI